MSSRRSTDLGPDIARARARYETARTALVGLLVVVVLASLGLLIAVSLTMRESQKQIKQLAAENKRDAKVVAELLARQQEADRNRQRLINEAVAAIAREQYRALVAHDNSVKEYLERSLRLLNQEVHAPSNKERPSAQSDPAAPAPAVPASTSGMAPVPQPIPAPPVAPPCEPRGKSGKCKQ